MSSPPSTNQIDSHEHVQLGADESRAISKPEIVGEEQEDQRDAGLESAAVDDGILAGENQTAEDNEASPSNQHAYSDAGEAEARNASKGEAGQEGDPVTTSSRDGEETQREDGTKAEAISEVADEIQKGGETAADANETGLRIGQQDRSQQDPSAGVQAAGTESVRTTTGNPDHGSPSQSEIPASSFVRVNSPAAGSSSSIFSSAPKKFSTVNINKKFLGKTSSSPVAGTPSPSALGAKPTGALGSLIRPSISPNPSSTSTHKLTSAKLTSVISSKPGTGALSSVPAIGWAKPSPRPSPGLSPSNDHPILSSPGLGTDVLRPTPSALGSLKRGQLTTPSLGFGLGAGNKMKKEWAPIASGEGYRSGLGREFPTAGEVIEGQRQAQSQAQSIAQARAAHNAALIEGLDSFRGVNRDPKMHYWDEDDDENAVDDVIDFGDGTTYTIAAMANPPPTQAQELDQIPEVPVSKEERFAEDFDRSWPPRGPPAMSGQSSRALYNDRSNRFEAHAENAPNQPPPRPQQILSRGGGRGSFDRPAHGAEVDSQRGPAMHSREGSRPLPPHLAGREPDRLPSTRDSERMSLNASNGLRSSLHDLPPHLRDAHARAPQQQHAPITSRPDRHFPPHHEQIADFDRAPRPDRWSTREKENVSNVEVMTPDSGRPRAPVSIPTAQTVGLDQTSATAQISPVISPKVPTSVPAPADVPPVSQGDVTIDQKDEMHEAAERARLRRQQEESEREARAERARQKAKQLEDKMKEMAAAKAAIAPAPVVSPTISKILPRPADSAARPVAPSQTPATAALHPASSRDSGIRSGQMAGPDSRRAEPTELWRRPAQQRTSFSGTTDIPKPSSAQRPQVISSQGSTDTQAVTQRADTARLTRDLPPQAILPNDVLDSMPSESPVAVYFADFSKPDGPLSPAQALTNVAPIADADAEGSRFGKRLNDAGTWRKPTATVAPPRGSPEIGLQSTKQAEERSHGAAIHQQAIQNSVDSAQTQDGSTVHEKPRRSSRPAESDNNFDQIMARIKSAIVAENSAATHARDVPTGKLPDATHDNISTEPTQIETARPMGSVQINESAAKQHNARSPVRYIPLPQPEDFSVTTAALPSDPPPAWKTFVTRLPKSRKAQKPLPRRRTRSDHMSPIPRGWALSWNPPFEQLNPNTLSRDEWLIPATYVRGKAVAPVSLPKRAFGRFVPSAASNAAVARSDMRQAKSDRPAAAESSQTVSVEEAKVQDTISRKIVVNLPRRSLANANARTSTTIAPQVSNLSKPIQDYPSIEPIEAAQTTEDLDSLLASPSPSETPLPTSGSRDRNAARQTPNRRLPDGTGVVFARPHGGSFSEEAEAKSSMRFMVSSELEIDNLLEEVNNMSMDGLTETVPDASGVVVRQQEEPSTHRKQQTDRSRATSPNTAASVAWAKSMPYPTIQANQGLSNRDHIKNVWSQSGNDHLQQQSGNSLMGIADDLPPSLSVSMQDLKEETDKQARRQNQLDTESPRFATIGAVRSDSSDRMQYSRLQQNATGESDSTDAHTYGSVSQMPNGNNYGYALGNDTPSPNLPHAGHGRSSLSSHNPPTNSSNVGGLPGQHRGQLGVWVPLNQAGMSSNAGMTTAMNGYMGMPVSPVYGSAAPMQKGNGRSSSHNGYLGNMQSSGGMYSHPTGPLDSPSMSYMRPNLTTNNAYQTTGPQPAYPASSQSYSMRDGYANYGLAASGMRPHGSTSAGPGHSRYASMGSPRNGGLNNYGPASYNDQAARGVGMHAGYHGMNGMVGSESVSRATGSSQAGGRLSSSGMSANGTVKRPW